MSFNPADEPTIDISLSPYMEERALQIALEKAATTEQRLDIQGLVELRAALMRRRAAFADEATARRHARGEIYSNARVAAINATGPTRGDMDRDISRLYMRQPDSAQVLMTHARVHFGTALMSSRLLLKLHPADVVDLAREMQRHEEAFAAAWFAAVGDPAFKVEMRKLQRDALRQLRTSTRPMYFVTRPEGAEFDDTDAHAMGKVWNKLDELAQMLDVEPLSNFIALPDEGDAGGTLGGRLLPTMSALNLALQRPDCKVPSKRAAITAMTKIRDAIRRLPEDGLAYFEVDT